MQEWWKLVMDKEKPFSLPPIFKFSAVVNVLPYYGNFHHWMWLMKRLSSETMKIWNNNEEAFWNWGREYKEVMIFSKDDLDDEWNILKDLRRKYFQYFNIPIKTLLKRKNDIIHLIQSKLLVYIEASYTNEDCYMVKLLGMEEESEYLSDTGWKELISEIREIRLRSANIKSLLFKLNNTLEWMIIKEPLNKTHTDLVSVTVFNSGKINANYETDKSIERYSRWSIEDWHWKPTTLVINNFFVKRNELNKLLLKIKEIKNIIINSDI